MLSGDPHGHYGALIAVGSVIHIILHGYEHRELSHYTLLFFTIHHCEYFSLILSIFSSF